jgi:diaminohydroxyphosphoribosylaminopyrimidine deaminase/5-amino-6-(5-phosphoribosylamino)uracil reductase
MGVPAAVKNDLAAVLADLGQRGINELHVEAGEKLNGSLLRAGLVDELLIYLAPSLLGPGRRLAEVFAQPLESLDQRLDLQFVDGTMVGPDLRLRAVTAQGQSAWAQAWPATAVGQGLAPAAPAPAYPG